MSKAEYMREYRKKEQIRNYEKQLQEIINNNPFFDPNVNFYLNPVSIDNMKKWHNENRLRFNLRCKIDGIIPTRQMYNDFSAKKDLKDRCVKYRLFCNSFHKKYGEFPKRDDFILNEVFKPEVEVDLTPQPGDPDIYVITPDDWAAQDNFECNIHKYGFSPEDYETFLKGRKTTNETRKEFIDFHHLPELFGIYTYNMKDHVFFA